MINAGDKIIASLNIIDEEKDVLIFISILIQLHIIRDSLVNEVYNDCITSQYRFLFRCRIRVSCENNFNKHNTDRIPTFVFCIIKIVVCFITNNFSKMGVTIYAIEL